jgi:superfamily II DNA or RNA helicase
MSQKTQSLPRPGDLVRVRRDDWRVLGVTAHADCAAVHLAGVGAGNIGCQRAVLHPFDRLLPLAPRRRLRLVARDAWLEAARVLAVRAVTHGSLRAAADARIDLFPYQFEPALALVRGETARVLIADGVGLGKTIQAGLVLAELRAREMSARTLIITPAGLREQWARELEDRFALPGVILDGPALRRAVASLPAGVNPWEASPVVITSLDFIKQPEVGRALDGTTWDLLVVDEAHTVAMARERHLAVDGLAARARWVLLLTATPHAGDDEGFASLCRLGQLDGEGPPVMFRRTTAEAGARRDRRVRLLRVALTPAEAALHALVDRYSRLVWDASNGEGAGPARLAMIVIRKRALSGVAALRWSLARRLERLGTRSTPAGEQLPLPLADESEGEADADDEVPDAALSSPGLSDVGLERRMLADILEAATSAMVLDSKTAALSRLLRRVAEPAIVFTEYRDTALALAGALASMAPTVVLHGGLDRAARREAVRRFLCGGARILVATDAAGQGLNLQTACRYVVNLELPWNPMRLEQRIGRVDRIGQTRRVHAVNLVAGGTAEEAILGRLVRRMERVRDAVGHDGDPIGMASRIAAAVIAPDTPAVDHVARLVTPAEKRAGAAPCFDETAAPSRNLAALALSELERLRSARRILQSRCRSSGKPVTVPRPSLETTAPWALIVDRMDSLPPGVLCLFRMHLINARGRLLEEMLLPVHAEVPVPLPDAWTAGHVPKTLLEVAGLLLPALGERARSAAGARLAAIAPDVSAGGRRIGDREVAIARLVQRQFRHGVTAPVQQGLFDQRELRQAAARRLAWARLHFKLDDRRARHEGADVLSLAGEPEPMLVLWIAPLS